MAISSSTRKAGPFLGNDATTVFPFAFKVFTAADLRVVNTSALGIESDLVLDTDYTVALNANQDNDPGGTVTRATALPTGERLTITSDVEALQPLVLTNNGGFYPRVINDAFDKITIIAQQLIEQVGRSLKLPISSTASATLPDPVANRLIAWNSSANGFTNVDPASIATVAAYADASIELFDGNGTQTAFTLAEDPAVLANLDVSISGVVQVGGEDFTWIGTTLTFLVAPPNGTRIQVRYTRAIPPVDLAAAVAAAEADRVATAADRVQTGLDASDTAADAVATAADRVATAADRVQTGLDASDTAADAVATAADRVATAADVAATADKVAATALAASTGAALVGFLQSGTGAVARTVQDKLRAIVTPEDFGAVGDGVADDTVAIQAAMDAADEVVGKDSAIYSVTNIQHRSDKTFRGNCEIKQRTAGSPAWFFDGTTARIERARLLGPHFRGHASSTVECVRMEESGGFAILGAEVDIQGTGGYHTLKIVCTGANAVYGCRITVLQHSSLNTGCVLSGVYNVYDLFISDAANGLAYDDTGAHSLFTRAISNCGQQSSATNSVWNKVTVEGWVGTGKDNALQFNGSNPSINNASIVNVPALTTPGGIGLNVGGTSWFAIRGLRIFGTDYPVYPIDLRGNLGGIIENASSVGGFDLEQYHTSPADLAALRAVSFNGWCATITAYGARMLGTATYDPASLADGAGVTTTVTVTGAALGDFAEATFSLDLQGIALTAWVSAADTVSVRFQNETGGAIDLASGTILARARKT